MHKATVVIGLGFGDEGKGATVDRVVRREKAVAVVRWNGGPQASHHVVLPDGRWHAFAQFGSGSFVPGVATHLSRGMLVDPRNLLNEEEALRENGVSDALDRTTIDPRCLVVTPVHKIRGRAREVCRGSDRHGSVGMGVGEAVMDADETRDMAIRVGDLAHEGVLREKIDMLLSPGLAAEIVLLSEDRDERERLVRLVDRKELVASYLDFGRRFSRMIVRDEDRIPGLLSRGHVVFEGAQGTLLDPVNGFAPYVTKTRCTADAVVDVSGLRHHEIRVVGVLRAFAHRHGPGPLPSEDPAGRDRFLAREHNCGNPWQGEFRTGWFDLVLARLGIDATGLDGADEIALTCLDRLSGLPEVRVCGSYVGPRIPDDDGGWRLELNSEPEDETSLVRAIRPAARQEPGPRSLADFLSRCRPRDVAVLPGWQDPLTGVRSVTDLPRAARDYVAFLDSGAGLGLRIGSVAVGPTHEQVMDVPWESFR